MFSLKLENVSKLLTKNSMIQKSILSSLLLFFLTAVPLSADSPISLSDWELQRSRYGAGTMESQTVTMSITVTNSGDQKLTSTKARLVFYTEKGKKIRSTKWSQVGTLGAADSKRLDFKEGRLAQFPAFACEVSYYLEKKKSSNIFHSSNHLVLPELLPKTPYEGISQLIIMAQQIQLSTVGRSKPKISLWVRNIGALDAVAPKVTIELKGKNKKKVRTIEQTLINKGKDLASGKDAFVDIILKKGLPSEFSGFNISLEDNTPKPKNNVVKFDEAFTKGELSLGHFTFTYNDDGTLQGEFSIFNDTSEDIPRLDANVNLIGANDKAAHSFTVPIEELKAGEKRTLKVSDEQAKPFEYLDFGFTTYSEEVTP